ncbi:sigma-70 family RNA polymerase sigma factor [Bacillus sp. es.036]|uniref:sigma-70 family RNA polymerase sigma factor n=1 Tax=Bacillus sp. es.036 TaxID=1761764 RepID=UPI000BF9AE2C|nr:sigma-70 family RNA polymerase sigma factor [Bacillus sp. es.036]PFG13536.1 RNA polymerase sigma-70 factor (ECF subfamily) [Bacillus sp. es.036]
MKNRDSLFDREGFDDETASETEIDLLIKEHSKQVFILAFSYVKDHSLAEDIAQEVFYKCYKNLHKFRKESSIKTWISRITVNTSKDFLRKRKYNLFHSHSHLLEVLVKRKSSEDEFLEKENRQSVMDIVLSLQPKYREVIILFYFQDFNTEEIALALKMNRNTVKTRLSRGRLLLKEKISGLEGGNYET